jgi:hypothetical protein
MWIPGSEQEIERALADGSIRETATFDAKAALPPPGKNKDLAKDICAMTVDGGVLLYGIGGNDPTRPDKLEPLGLAGAAERIDQVAQTGISEPPVIEIHDIASERGDGKGYLAVEIPASPRAPHMLTLGGDNRYWGRGPTGNRLLTEGEVARLYTRREVWDVDRASALEAVITAMPFEFADPPEQLGPMVVAIWPVAPNEGIVRRAADGQDIGDFFKRELPAYAAENDPYPGQGTSGIEAVFNVAPRGANRWLFQRDRDNTGPYQAQVELTADGAFTYWHSPTINSTARRGGEGQRLLLMEQSVTRAVHQAVASANFIYNRGGYMGAVDLGVGVLHIERATAASLAQGWDPGPEFGAADFRAHDRLTSRELANPKAVTRHMLHPLYESVSVRDYDPYTASRFPDPEEA